MSSTPSMASSNDDSGNPYIHREQAYGTRNSLPFAYSKHHFSKFSLLLILPLAIAQTDKAPDLRTDSSHVHVGLKRVMVGTMQVTARQMIDEDSSEIIIRHTRRCCSMEVVIFSTGNRRLQANGALKGVQRLKLSVQHFYCLQAKRPQAIAREVFEAYAPSKRIRSDEDKIR
ncbi:hypothetical protein BDP27DRAFT_1483414 [Rhodocollybia butyracea]|uniref:Uncharacterized protein n=1 Tax=Rhodocollybia butyracea TaxID=206335 RepID=A0A9P5U1B6_9AGAR|nr:hypothetical protein BDP27DRAFT_1483414 [Rhodocollybia butyracea]